MNTKSFPMPPPGKFARIFPILVGAVFPLVMIVAIVLAAGGNTGWEHALPALLVLPLVAGVLAWSMHSRQVELLADTLRVRRWPIPRGFALDSLDLEHARVADLRQDSALQPTVKLIGSRLPGFRSGWFRLRDGHRAYVLSTSSSRHLYLPRQDGSALLLGVERPEALLQALRDAGSRRG